MRRLLFGAVMTAATATATWMGLASDAVSEWRMVRQAAEPLDEAEQRALAECRDPGGVGLSRVLAQDLDVDCAFGDLVGWLADHADAPELRPWSAPGPSHLPRRELRTAAARYGVDGGVGLATALEHPFLDEVDRADALVWLAVQEDIPALHPRTAEALARTRLDTEAWIPDPALLARALRGTADGPWEARARAATDELGVPVDCAGEACREALLAALEDVAIYDPVAIPSLLADALPPGAAGDAAERLAAARRWVQVEPDRLVRTVRLGPGTAPDDVVLDGGSVVWAAWTALELAESAGASVSRDHSGLRVDGPGGELWLGVCPGDGPVTAADLASLVRARAVPAAGDTAAAAGAELLRSLAPAASTACSPP